MRDNIRRWRSSRRITTLPCSVSLRIFSHIFRWAKFRACSRLPPQRHQPRHDDDEVNLAEERLQHGERLPDVACRHEVAIADGGERCVAEKEVVVGRRMRLTSKERERGRTEKIDGEIDEGEERRVGKE